MSVMGVIPARFGSTRFPGKPLADIAGQSLIQRVWGQVSACKRLDAAVVATDDRRIFEHVESFGGRALMTGSDHASGTDRLGEVAQLESHDFYVNIQGDEPLLPPLAIDELVLKCLAVNARMGTLVTQLDAQADQREIADPNVVKVVADRRGFALYFSRSAIPYSRDGRVAQYLKHIGIYLYARESLLTLCRTERSPLEVSESLEQLRALENDIRILLVSTDYNPVGVDTPEDVARVVERLG